MFVNCNAMYRVRAEVVMSLVMMVLCHALPLCKYHSGLTALLKLSGKHSITLYFCVQIYHVSLNKYYNIVTKPSLHYSVLCTSFVNYTSSVNSTSALCLLAAVTELVLSQVN